MLGKDALGSTTLKGLAERRAHSVSERESPLTATFTYTKRHVGYCRQIAVMGQKILAWLSCTPALAFGTAVWPGTLGIAARSLDGGTRLV